MTDVLWSPEPSRIENSPLRAYLNWLEAREGRPFPDHDAFWAWSVEDLDRFWLSVIDYYQVDFSTPWTQVRTADPMPHTRWFTGARLNWAQHMVRTGADDAAALVCVQEGGRPARELSFGELRRSVAASAGWLRRAGVRPGDRVVAYLPNTEHAVIACLATAAVGAVWACCSSDFGAEGTIGRLAQLEPSVLIAADGYHWNGKEIDRSDVVTQLRENLPTLRQVVHVPHVFDRPVPDGSTPWDELISQDEPLVFEPVEFSHPLWVLFTSGTTGLPKGLVHGHGGITLQALMWSGLYGGLRAGERLFSYTSTGWALWNIELGALTQGASIVLYEGSPNHPAGAVWEVAARTHADAVLLGAAVVTASASTGVSPRQDYDLSRLRTVMVSGSALPTAGYHWLLEHVSPDARIDSTSGGTDISGSFVGANEYAPVRAGRIGGRLAGVDCAAWNEDGEPVIDAVGDLVITQPMPSMPVYLWNDADAVRYTESYFDTWPGVWRHGDWVTMHADGSVSIHGRSDSTLNRQGVRLGSSDFYDVLETMPEITETLVIGVDLPDDGYWLGLFVVPAPGHAVDDALKQKIVSTLRTRLTPRHVPDEILEAPAVPHTLTGKRLEVPIKKLLTGRQLEKAANIASVDDPDALRWYARFAADRSGRPGLVQLMRLGATLAHLSSGPPYPIAEWARRLVGEGFESLWTPQVIGRGVLVPDPFVTLAVAATAAEGSPTIELGTATVQVPLHHPADLAHRVLSLMSVCGTRLTLGVSPGSTDADFAAFDREYAARFRTFDQNLSRLRILLARGREDLPEFRNSVGPPLLLGSWGAKVERAAREFDGWLASAYRRTPDQIIAAHDRYRAAGGRRAIVCAIPVSGPDDLGPTGELLHRYAAAGFDDAVVLIEPGGRTPRRSEPCCPEGTSVSIGDEALWRRRGRP